VAKSVIRISSASDDIVKAFMAERPGKFETRSEAVDALISTARGRMLAVAKDAAKRRKAVKK
jgi:hypothetical protein